MIVPTLRVVTPAWTLRVPFMTRSVIKGIPTRSVGMVSE